MKIKLLDVNSFIEASECKPVTNPVYFQTGLLPTEDGLFSYEIFGDMGSKERKEKYGYINLGSKFLHPVVYKILLTLDNKIESIISGNLFVKITDNGKIIEDDNGDTGIDFLYDNFDKLIFNTSPSDMRKTKIRLIKNLGRDRIFIDKFIVMPAYLRDFNPNNKTGGIQDVDVINDIYSKIIRLSNSISMGGSFSFITNNTKYQIQKLLLEIYSKLTTDLSSKKGILRKRLMSKSVDYAVRSVITAPHMYSNKHTELEVPFGYTGIPMSQLCVLFYPFYVNYIVEFIEMHKEAFTKIETKNGLIEIDYEDIKSQFSDLMIKKMVSNYIQNIPGRFESIKVKDKEGNEHKINLFKKELGRSFTITDLLYLATESICENKHVFVTRYPVESFRV